MAQDVLGKEESPQRPLFKSRKCAIVDDENVPINVQRQHI